MHDGVLQTVHSFNPLHLDDGNGKLVDINTAILSNDYGYYVNDIYTPAQFSKDPMNGVTVSLGM